MELRYLYVLVIGIFVVFVLNIIKFKKVDKRFSMGKKVANTKYVKNNITYQKILKKYKLLVVVNQVLLSVALFSSFLLISRPVSTDKNISEQYQRDIFLCMDVSSSVNELNKETVTALKDIVSNLEGERFGISIFNSSSVVLVPLTDDYDYVLSVLDQIHTSISASELDDLDAFYDYSYIIYGTTEGAGTYGSSLVGDGLVSCVNSFSKLESDQDRTRIVILSTDNDVYGDPLFNLEEAASYSKEKNVIVYGIATENTTSQDYSEFQSAITKTGGKVYKQSTNGSTEEIVNNIEKTSKSLIENYEQTIKADAPLIPLIILVISLISFFIVSKKVSYYDN